MKVFAVVPVLLLALAGCIDPSNSDDSMQSCFQREGQTSILECDTFVLHDSASFDGLTIPEGMRLEVQGATLRLRGDLQIHGELHLPDTSFLDMKNFNITQTGQISAQGSWLININRWTQDGGEVILNETVVEAQQFILSDGTFEATDSELYDASSNSGESFLEVGGHMHLDTTILELDSSRQIPIIEGLATSLNSLPRDFAFTGDGEVHFVTDVRLDIIQRNDESWNKTVRAKHFPDGPDVTVATSTSYVTIRLIEQITTDSNQTAFVGVEFEVDDSPATPPYLFAPRFNVHTIVVLEA